MQSTFVVWRGFFSFEEKRKYRFFGYPLPIDTAVRVVFFLREGGTRKGVTYRETLYV